MHCVGQCEKSDGVGYYDSKRNDSKRNQKDGMPKCDEDFDNEEDVDDVGDFVEEILKND